VVHLRSVSVVGEAACLHPIGSDGIRSERTYVRKEGGVSEQVQAQSVRIFGFNDGDAHQ
jgi:hypothetical protein